MFRVLSKVASSGMRAVSNNSRLGAASQVRMMSGAKQESDAEFDAKYIAYFDRKDIDGWEIRKVCCFPHMILLDEGKSVMALFLFNSHGEIILYPIPIPF